MQRISAQHLNAPFLYLSKDVSVHNVPFSSFSELLDMIGKFKKSPFNLKWLQYVAPQRCII